MATKKQILKFIPTHNKFDENEFLNEEFHIEHLELEKGENYYDPFIEFLGYEYQNINPNFDINVKPEYKIIDEQYFEKDIRNKITSFFWKKYRFRFANHIVLINREMNHIVRILLSSTYRTFGIEDSKIYDIRRNRLLPKMIYKMYEVLKSNYYARFLDLDEFYYIDVTVFAKPLSN